MSLDNAFAEWADEALALSNLAAYAAFEAVQRAHRGDA